MATDGLRASRVDPQKPSQVGASRAAAGRQVAVDAASAEERMNGSEDNYSRFLMPSMWGMDKSSGNPKRQHTEKGVCELTPFFYRGESPWPFKYSIPDNKGGKE